MKHLLNKITKSILTFASHPRNSSDDTGPLFHQKFKDKLAFNKLLYIQPWLPDFSRYNIPKWGKICQITITYTKWPQNIPKIYKITIIRFTKWPQNIPYKIYLNWNFRFENIPSGNPAYNRKRDTLKLCG
jgi:hypothetical protein